MKMSKMMISTLKDVSQDIEITSHRLLLKAGLVRQSTQGIYQYLPIGLKVLHNIQKIVREELEKIDAEEILASALIPSHLWEKSGRYHEYGPELMRLVDRGGSEFILGPTHEEIFTALARSELKSYKQLPKTIYQIQSKYRDELRPRYGLMRSREFIMKDAYSFDYDETGLDHTFQIMQQTYHTIFKSCGLDTIAVEADTGSIGGSSSIEFMVPSNVGEDSIAVCQHCGYNANVEKASNYIKEKVSEPYESLKQIETINIHTIDEVSKYLNVRKEKIAKTIIYQSDDKVIAVMVRGDREVNEIKLKNAINGSKDIVLASSEVVEQVSHARIGFVGPIDLQVDYLFVDQEVVAINNMVVGASINDYHLINVNYQRDFSGIVGDYHIVVEGDLCPKCQQMLNITKGIEVGHIFKLGTKYSKAMEANFLDCHGKLQPFVMGCYGIGISRVLQAIIEQNHDDDGIIWPLEIAPYHVHILIVNQKNQQSVDLANQIYQLLLDKHIKVLLDDRDERIGVKFKDADLYGATIRITVGKDSQAGIVEVKQRNSKEVMKVQKDNIVESIKNLLDKK